MNRKGVDKMKKHKTVITFVVILAIYLSTFISTVSAHPGGTASDGCHYCRTNCDKWGVPWNQRHCHNNYIPPVVNTLMPTKAPEQITDTTTKPVLVKAIEENSLSLKTVFMGGLIIILGYLGFMKFRK